MVLVIFVTSRGSGCARATSVQSRIIKEEVGPDKKTDKGCKLGGFSSQLFFVLVKLNCFAFDLEQNMVTVHS